MNITLSADEELIKKVREYAAKRGTSLNQVIRQYMEQLTNLSDVEKHADKFARLSKGKKGASPPGFVIDREEAHEREDFVSCSAVLSIRLIR